MRMGYCHQTYVSCGRVNSTLHDFHRQKPCLGLDPITSATRLDLYIKCKHVGQTIFIECAGFSTSIQIPNHFLIPKRTHCVMCEQIRYNKGYRW